MAVTKVKKRHVLSETDKEVLARFPQEVLSTFSEHQKYHISHVLGDHFGKQHKVDLRGTFPVPFLPSKVYFVFLMGRDIRQLSRHEQNMAIFTIILLVILGLSISIMLGLIVLYVAKSALGINLFDEFSLGIWSYLSG